MPSRKHSEYWGGKIPWIGIRDAKANHGQTIQFTTETTNQLGIDNSSARVLPAGTVCLSRTASVGYVVVMGRPMATSQDFVNWVCSEKLDPRFLMYLFLAETRSFQRFSSGAIHQTIYYPEVKAFHICLPPVQDQRRIVVTLDNIFESLVTATANAKKNYANSRELFESYLNSIFTHKRDGWAEKALSEVCSISSKLIDPRKPEFIDLPHLGAGNMISMTGELVEIKTAREEGLKSGKFVFDDKMVLYSKIRPYLRKACRPDFEGLCSADVYPLSPHADLLDRDFLFHMLMSRDFTDYAISGSDRAAMPKVNRDHLFRYRISLPDVSEQRRLAAQLDELSQKTRCLHALYENKLAKLADLKQSLLQKAFSGELTAQPDKMLKEAVA